MRHRSYLEYFFDEAIRFLSFLNGFDYNNIGVEKSFLVSLLIQKVLKLFNRGSPTIPSPLAFAEGLFVFVIFLQKKRI
jgi:hypothetical protein